MSQSVPQRPASTPRAEFRERLVPSPWTWLGIVGFAVFTYIALVVVDATVAAWTAPLVLAIGLVAAWCTSPVVRVEGATLVAGQARIDVAHLGPVTILDRAGVLRALGPGFDPRTYACLRTGTGNAVTLPVLDPQDPTPLWIVSTRRPRSLADAIDLARDRSQG